MKGFYVEIQWRMNFKIICFGNLSRKFKKHKNVIHISLRRSNNVCVCEFMLANVALTLCILYAHELNQKLNNFSTFLALHIFRIIYNK